MESLGTAACDKSQDTPSTEFTPVVCEKPSATAEELLVSRERRDRLRDTIDTEEEARMGKKRQKSKELETF